MIQGIAWMTKCRGNGANIKDLKKNYQGIGDITSSMLNMVQLLDPQNSKEENHFFG